MSEKFIALERNGIVGFPSMGTNNLYCEGSLLKFRAEGDVAKNVLIDGGITTFDGEPVNYVAAIPAITATAETVFGASTITTTSIEAGDLGNYRLVNLTQDVTPTPNAPLTVIVDANEINVWLATDSGDPATHVLSVGAGGGTKTITTTLEDDGPSGNLWTLETKLPTTSGPFGPVILSESSLSASVDGSAIIVSLATTAATPGVVSITESVVTNPGTITLSQKSPYAGTWDSAGQRVKMGIVMGSAGGALTVSCVNSGTQLVITITLGMNSEGLPDNAKNTDDLVAAAINTALATVTGPYGSENWTSFLLAASESEGVFESTNLFVGMLEAEGGTTAVNAAILTGSANQADEVAAVIAALEGVATAVVGAGAGNEEVSVTAESNFSGGGENFASISTVSEVVAAVNLAENREVEMEVTAGDGADVIPLDGEPIELSGGVDEIPAVLGTPADLGRLATDGTDVWMALKDDPTTTQDGWVKIFTATP